MIYSEDSIEQILKNVAPDDHVQEIISIAEAEYNRGYIDGMNDCNDSFQAERNQVRPEPDFIEGLLKATFSYGSWEDIEEMRKSIEKWLMEAYRKGQESSTEDDPYDRAQEDMRE